MNECTLQGCGIGLQYFPSTSSGHRLTDHLGSVVATTDSYGTLTSQQRYLPFGGVRADMPSANVPSTDYGYTGQRNLDAGIGLMDYRAHFYSPYLNRFIQPDTLIPSPANPQAWNRYAYVMNSPVNFNDPTGHVCEDPEATAARGGGNRRCDGADRPGQVSHGGGLGNLGGGNSGRGGAQSEGDDLEGIVGLNNPSDQACTVSSCAVETPGVCPLGQTCWMNPSEPFDPFADPYGEGLIPIISTGPQYYYTYEGSIIPIIGLGVDLGGMIIDGSSVVASLGFGVPGVLVSAEAQFYMSTIEFIWSGFMEANGQYEAVYDHSANILDSTAARYTDTQEVVPIAGFSASLISAYNNIQVISSGYVAHPATFSWDSYPAYDHSPFAP